MEAEAAKQHKRTKTAAVANSKQQQQTNGGGGRRERKKRFDVRKLLNIRGSANTAAAAAIVDAAGVGGARGRSPHVSDHESSKASSSKTSRRSGRVKAVNGEQPPYVPKHSVEGPPQLLSGKRERKRKKFWDEQQENAASGPPAPKVAKKPDKKVNRQKQQRRDRNASAESTKNASSTDEQSSQQQPQQQPPNGKTLEYLQFDLNADPASIAKQMVEGVNIPGPGVPIPIDSSSLPAGWEKRVIQRGIGVTKGKWDVSILSPSGKSFRSKIDLQKYCEENELPFSSDSFDFSLDENLKRLRQIWKQHIAGPQARAEAASATGTSASSAETAGDDKVSEVEGKKSKNADSSGVAEDSLSPSTASPCPEFAIESETGQGLRCSIDNCRKLFRNDRLLNMHVKHYHPNFFETIGLSKATESKTSENPPLSPPAAVTGLASSVLTPTTTESSTNPVPKKSEKRKLSQSLDKSENKRMKVSSSSEATDDLKSVKRGPGRLSMPRRQSSAVTEDDEVFRANRSRNDSILSVGSESSFAAEDATTTATTTIMTAATTTTTTTTMTSGPVTGSATPPTFRMSKRRQAQLQKKNPSPVLQISKVEDTPDGKCYMEEYMAFIGDSRVSQTEDGGGGGGGGTASYPPSEMDASVASEHLTSEEVVNCTCKRTEEDGLMIQCDICLCWQHGYCLGLEGEGEVPQKHICKICLDPPNGRTDARFSLDQDWLKEGKFSSVPSAVHQQHLHNAEEDKLKRELAFKKLSELMADLTNLGKVLHSLRVKLHVASQRNNSKVFMWSSPWENAKHRSSATSALSQSPATESPVRQPNPSANTTSPPPTVSAPEERLLNGGELRPPTPTPVPDSNQTSSPETGKQDVGANGITEDQQKSHSSKENGDLDERKGSEGKPDTPPPPKSVEDNGNLQVDEYLDPSMIPSVSEVQRLLPSIIQASLQDQLSGAEQIISPGGGGAAAAAAATQPQVIIPEQKRLDRDECRLHLLEHIGRVQAEVTSLLDSVEEHLSQLERSSLPTNTTIAVPALACRTKTLVTMLSQDLRTAKKLLGAL